MDKRKINRNFGAPVRFSGLGSSNERFKIRYKSFTSEGSGPGAVSKMRRAGEAAVETYGQILRTENNEALLRDFRKRLFDQLYQKPCLTSVNNDKNSQNGKGQEYVPLVPKHLDPNTPMVGFEDMRLFASIIHSGDRGVIIAPKGVGKSGLSMSIGAAIALGKSTGLWPKYDESSHTPQRVLYYDAELTDTDIFNRYGRYGYEFPDNFERYDCTQFKDAYQILADLQWKVENQMSEGDEATVFIDNITKIHKTEQVSEINWYNEKLDEIYNLAHNRGIVLTLITIVHVSGEYKTGSPITLKDAAGSSNLTNFSNFVIALEQPKDVKKIVLVKVLSSRGEPEPENVCVLRRIGKDEGTYYHFEYVGEMAEKMALQEGQFCEYGNEPKHKKDYREEARAIKAWLDEDPHRTYDDAADQFKCSHSTIDKRLKLLKNPSEM